jgi:hypothetical protein
MRLLALLLVLLFMVGLVHAGQIDIELLDGNATGLIASGDGIDGDDFYRVSDGGATIRFTQEVVNLTTYLPCTCAFNTPDFFANISRLIAPNNLSCPVDNISLSCPDTGGADFNSSLAGLGDRLIADQQLITVAVANLKTSIDAADALKQENLNLQLQLNTSQTNYALAMNDNEELHRRVNDYATYLWAVILLGIVGSYGVQVLWSKFGWGDVWASLKKKSGAS